MHSSGPRICYVSTQLSNMNKSFFYISLSCLYPDWLQHSKDIIRESGNNVMCQQSSKQ